MRRLFLLIFLTSSFTAFCQNKSNRGKEFWLGYGHNIIMTSGPFTDPVNSQEMALYLSTTAAANVTVSINGTSWVQNVTIPANSVNASILIPKTGVNDARILSEGLFAKGIHIVSDTPIVVYAHQYTTQSSAATMLMPVETYGYHYFSLNFEQSSNFPNAYSWFYAVASENNTRLQITPADTTVNGWLPNNTYTVNLNKGELYNVFGKLESSLQGKDLSGSKIVSVAGADGKCHPFALFSGSSRNVLWSSNCSFSYIHPTTGQFFEANGNGGELLMQQIFPANAWGTRYITYHTINNTNNNLTGPYKNLYRVAVKEPGTIVKRNGVVLTGLQRNFFYEFASSSGDVIESNKPILLAQYPVNSNQCQVPVPPPNPLPANGDPEMMYLSPVEQGIKSTLFYGARRTNAINLVFVNVIVPNNGVASMLIDGTPVEAWEQIPHPVDANYTVVIRRFLTPEGPHSITCDSTFTAIHYGNGDYESFGYNAGCFVNNLNTYGQIKNTLNVNNKVDTFTCIKTPFRPIAKVAYRLTNLHWKLSQPQGINPNVDSVFVNPIPSDSSFINGRRYYHYTLQQDFLFNTPGSYTIPINYTSPEIDACSNTEDAFITVLVKPSPKADFSISAQQCLSDTVRFTGTTSTENGLFNYASYLWNFDDATTQNVKDAKKRFATSGNHDVRYRVYADNGCIGDTTKTITITNGTGPQIGFTMNGKFCADSTITFTSAIPASANTSYWWNFGDGQIQTTSNNTITHNYAAAVNRIVRHTATITNGCNPDTAQQTITAINTNPPAVPFTATGDTLCISKPIQINAVANGVSKWNWNFGNATGNQTPPFNYAYTTAGNYTINLTVTDANGCGSAATTQPIIIAPKPVVSAGPDKFVPFNGSTTLDATLANANNYTINWLPNTYLNNATILNPVTTPGQSPVTYTINVIDKVSLCTGSDKVIITPISKLYIPTGFTPNNDGKNDKWEIIGMALYPDGVVTVYNRWGEKIFETKNYYQNPWNGKYKGLVQPIGSYIYVIQLNDAANQILKGTVTIIQ